MTEKYYKFSVLTEAGGGESLAIVSGDWFGTKQPTPTQVRNRIKKAIAPWFKTPLGAYVYDRFGEFDLGDLYLHYTPEIDKMICQAGIVNLDFDIKESTSNWRFSDSLFTP